MEMCIYLRVRMENTGRADVLKNGSKVFDHGHSSTKRIQHESLQRKKEHGKYGKNKQPPQPQKHPDQHIVHLHAPIL